MSIDNLDSSAVKPLDLSLLAGFNLDAISSLLASIVNSTSSAMQEMSNQQVEESTEQADLIEKTLTEKQRDILSLLKKNDDNILNYKNSLFMFRDSIEKLYGEQEKNITKALLLNDSSTITSNMIDQLYTKVISLRSKLANYHNELTDSKIKYTDFSTNNAKEIKDNKLEKRDEVIKDGYDKLLATVEVSLSLISVDKISKLAGKMVIIANNSDSKYTSLPLQFSKDQTTLKISITPHDSGNTLPSYHTQLTFPVHKKSYLAIGPGLYSAGFSNESYSIKGQAISDTSNGYTLVPEHKGSPEYGVSILLHYGTKFGYKRASNGIGGIHFSAGTGFSFTNPIKPRILLGGGLSFGDRHRLTLDAGLAFGYVDRLSRAFQVGTVYSEKPESVTISRMQYTGFYSVGYMFCF